MFFVLKTTVTMPGLPVVNKHLGVLCFITQRLCESTMIFVCVSENDTAEIGNAKACVAQTRTQRLDRFFRLWSGINNRQRIFSDQIDVYRTDVERRR